PAVAGDPAIGGRAVLEGHGINAVAEPGLRGQAQVGGRETEFPPALLAADHLALHEPAMAKPASGLSNPALRKRRTYAGRRNRRTRLVDDFADDGDRKAEPVPLSRERLGSSRPSAAVTKVVPDDRRHGPQARRENRLGKCIGR